MTTITLPGKSVARRGGRAEQIKFPRSLHEHVGLLLHGVSWRQYELLLQATEGQHLSITFDRGDLEIMPPLPRHEYGKKFMARLVEMMATEMRIPILGVGSATFRREAAARGLEPDECYYVQHEAAMRDKLDIDLDVDPPPDLAVEIDVTRRSIDREDVYAGLRVPELWRYNEVRVEFLRLSAEGHYKPVERSIAFPFLTAAELQSFLALYGTKDQTTLVLEFARHVRRTARGLREPQTPKSGKRGTGGRRRKFKPDQ